MYRINIKKFLALLLAFALLLPLAGKYLPQQAYAVNQSDVEKVQQERDELAAQQRRTQSKIDQLKEEKASAIEQKEALDERNMLALQQLELIEIQVKLYSNMIEEKAQDVEEAKQLEDDQLERYRVRVRAMEENGGYDMLMLLMNVESFSELISAVDDIDQIMQADRALEDSYIEARENHEALQADYEQTKAELEQRQAELTEKQQELEQMIEEATELIKSLEEDIEKAQKEYEAAERARAAAEWQISQLIAEINRENERKRNGGEGGETPADPGTGGETPADPGTGGETPSDPGTGGETPSDPGTGGEGESGGDTPAPTPAPTPVPEPTVPSAGGSDNIGTGSLQWPVPSSHVVTSRYGWRIHPITGEEKFHSGMDIDGYGNEGGAIVACDNGVVSKAAWYGGYGNCIIIDHGNGMQTLYGHMSSFAVSEGDSVTKGQTIGGLGSTGVATGTHCHLEVFVNGGRVDPAGYFSGITYYDC